MKITKNLLKICKSKPDKDKRTLSFIVEKVN